MKAEVAEPAEGAHEEVVEADSIIEPEVKPSGKQILSKKKGGRKSR